MGKAMVFFRLVKAEKGHPFAGLYGVEKIKVRDNQIYSKELVHEWDLRIISESILARLGGSDAYESYSEDHDLEDLNPDVAVEEAKARKAEEMELTKRKLNKELKFKGS